MKTAIICLGLGLSFIHVATTLNAQDLSFTETENQSVEGYLERLGLSRMSQIHLEQRFDRAKDSQVRQQLAIRLADFYANDLLATTDSNRSSDTEEKADRLLSLYPDWQDPLLPIAVLHARYRTLNSDFYEWWYSGKTNPPTSELVYKLSELMNELVRFKQRMDSQVDEANVTSQLEGVAQLGQSRMESALLHSQYLVGWTAFYRSLAEVDRADDWLQLSEDSFREFLQLEPDQVLGQISSSWLDLDSEWIRRGVIGVALVKRQSRQAKTSELCFEMLRKMNRPDVQQAALPWELKSRLFAGDQKGALELAESLTENQGWPHEAKIPFWLTAAKMGLGQGVTTRSMQQLIQLSFAGLARAQRPEMLGQLVSEYNVQLPEDTFLANWVAGYVLFFRAEGNHDPQLTSQARERLVRALALNANDGVAQEDVARCYFYLGRMDFEAKEFQVAAERFQKATEALRGADDALAVQSQWLRGKSLVELSRHDSSRSNEAFAAFDNLLRWFPQSPLSFRAEFEKLKLSLRTLPDKEAVQRLLTVDQSRPEYSEALFLRVQKQYRVWLDEFKKGADAELELAQLKQWEQELQQWSPQPTPQGLKAKLYVIDALIRRNLDKEKEIREQNLESAKLQAESLRADHEELLFESKYYEFLEARNSEADQALPLAYWLLKNAEGSAFENSPLIFVAQHSRTRLESGSLNPDELEQAIEVYTKLSQRFGDTSSDLSRKPNARVACFTLAKLLKKKQLLVQADQMNQKLLNLFPNQKDYIQLAAEIKMERKLFEEARNYWRRLASGSQAGSEEWLLAKLKLAECLGQTDKTAATQLIGQTKRLCPDMSVGWQTRFHQLEKRIQEVE